MIDSLSVVISTPGTDITADGESDATGYLIDRDGFGFVGGSWDRIYAEARGYHGGVLVDARMVNGAWILPLRIVGDDADEVRTLRNALFDAVSQFTYTLTITQDSADAEVWDAMPADWANGGDLMLDFHTGRTVWQTTLTVPVYPIAS